MPDYKKRWIIAAAADLVLILAFAAIGRDAHARGDILGGVFLTAWPFLAGAAVGWLASRAWKDALALWPSGVSVWIGAVLVGMLLRAVTNQTVVLPFIIVATLALGLFLLGYRALTAFAARLSRNRLSRH
ncbi:DUF3054 domain-containing protein [Paenarthrobacter sp. S56]|uniref:DUF3054 domain-containing protein n=1 Tax=Paenarthrobacter sp. S56 TaxID=3138179 RepID=UPI00321AADD6